MRMALIHNGMVENIIEAEPGFAVEDGYLLLPADDAVGPGWIYAEGKFHPPAPVPRPAPAFVTPLQMRRALRRVGLASTLDALLAGADEEAREAWEYALVIERADPLVAALATAAKRSSADIDDLFRLGASL